MGNYHSNSQLQAEQPEYYGPYLPEGERYVTPRTPENLDKACAAAGLDELPERYKGERGFYRDLMFEFWILFDDKCGASVGWRLTLISTTPSLFGCRLIGCLQLRHR